MYDPIMDSPYAPFRLAWQMQLPEGGAIYRLDTFTARHPKEDEFGYVKCLYIKAAAHTHYNVHFDTIVDLMPVKRNLWQKIKFIWWFQTKFCPWIMEKPERRIKL